ncbi:MAG: hypothetical protein WC284_08400 [Candidimonas sp.]
MKTQTDIDIDVADRNVVLRHFDHIPASIINGNSVKKHNTGIYFHKIPIDPITGLSSIDHKAAQDRGYFKIDMLNAAGFIYGRVRDSNHMKELLQTEPIWELLTYREFVEGHQIWHLHGHFETVKKMSPKNIDQIAMILGMIRPAKANLIGKDWDEIEKTIWIRPQNPKLAKSFFKKPHAYAYAHLIVLQMNLIVEELQKSDNNVDKR